MPTEFMGILLEYFLDEPTGTSPQFLEEYSKETKAEFLIRFKKTLDEKQEKEINLEQIELEMKVFNFIKKQSESFFDEFIEEQKILFTAPQQDKTLTLPKKEAEIPPKIEKTKSKDTPTENPKAVQAQKDFQLLNGLFKNTAITCLLPIEKLKQFLRMLPYFHEHSLEEILYIFLQEPRATELNKSSQSFGLFSKNQPMVMLPSEPTEENGERLITYYRATVSKDDLKIKVKNKEIFSYLISQLITKTTNAVKTGAPNQKRFEYLAVCFAYGIRENTLQIFEKNNFFLEETDPKLLELSLQNILNEIHLIQDNLSKKDPSNSKKKKTSQELLHKKLEDAKEKQNK
ncbi:hypothetical protein [Lactococcus lactis]|uniref:hypothetical protein n=1 Tax=Lactococcus lactis TaxID=1358 RepID=UPI0022DF323F|nr:hypothetical protein [Lactococcus lactis]